MYVESSTCVRVKGGESEELRIGSVVRQGCILSHWLFNVYGWGDEDEDGDGKEGSEIPGGWVRVKIAWPLVCR